MSRTVVLAALLVTACTSSRYGVADDRRETPPRAADATDTTSSSADPAPAEGAAAPDDPEQVPADPAPPPEPPPGADAGADAEADAGPPCALGDGLYCGGHGVPGKSNELHRCTGGVPVLEETCASDCARMPDGIDDVCACALGDGLYCGGNGVNGDAASLYRCTGGVVTLEHACASGCAKMPDGINDRCQ